MELNRVLGLVGSSSRIIFNVSSSAWDFSRSRSNGGSPASNSYKNCTQRIDVAAGVDVQVVELGLLGRHVLQRADDLAKSREHRLFGQLVADRLGHAEVDHLGDRLVVVQAPPARWTV